MFTRFLRLSLPLLTLCSVLLMMPHARGEGGLDLKAIENIHPRLFVDASDFDTLRERDWDALGERYVEFLYGTGEAMLDVPLVPYEMAGYRLLMNSQRALKRITTWSLLYRLKGDTRYRDRAIRELENVVSFPDWNPRHFLDVGELSLAVAIGTDWLWDDLTEAQRDRFLEALKEKAIQPSLDEAHPDNWWMYYYNNWNPVCHTGLTAAALLLAERDPELAQHVISRAIRAFPAALDSYQPDGAYPEGPGYWDYGTTFATLFLNIIDRAFGSTLGLDDDPAFRASATYRSLVVTPTGRFYNYADGYPLNRFSLATAWYATRYGDAAAEYEMRRGLKAYLDQDEWEPVKNRGRLMPFLALWYPGSQEDSPDEAKGLPNVWLGRGPNPVGFIREGWGSREQFFFGFKGGDGSVSHAHLDAGSFILEDEGVRWAVDLGSQNYGSIENLGFGLWDRRQHSDRWRVFRLGPFSHNILLIDQRYPSAEDKAEIVSLEQKGNLVEGIVDLSPVYGGQCDVYERVFRIHDFSVVEITDRIFGAREKTERQGRTPATIRWRMVTEAAVQVDGNTAVLKQDGKTLYLVVAGPNQGFLRSESLEAPRDFWDAANPGVAAVEYWTKTDDEGDQTVRVLMSTDKEALDSVLGQP